MRDRAVWPGARITFGRLHLTPGLWEPMPPPEASEPSAALIQAQIREARTRILNCPVEKRALAVQPKGRRIPPRYGPCKVCEWSHALLPGDGGAE